MPTEEELLSGEFNPSEDHGGMGEIIDNLWNHIARKRVKIIRLIEKKNYTEAVEMEKTVDDMAAQMDRLIKNYMSYDKFQKLINPPPKDKKTKGDGSYVPPHVRMEKSLNGDIVQTIPKK